MTSTGALSIQYMTDNTPWLHLPSDPARCMRVPSWERKIKLALKPKTSKCRQCDSITSNKCTPFYLLDRCCWTGQVVAQMMRPIRRKLLQGKKEKKCEKKRWGKTWDEWMRKSECFWKEHVWSSISRTGSVFTMYRQRENAHVEVWKCGNVAHAQAHAL